MAETEPSAGRGQWQRSEGGERGGGGSAEGGGGGGGLGTHWSEDEGGDWGSVGETLRAVAER